MPAADSGTWADLDLSHATFRMDLTGMTVTNVRFDRVGWQNWIVRASWLTDCSFKAADLRDSRFDDGNGRLASEPVLYPASRYERCDFTRTRTGHYASWGRAVFEDCLFDAGQPELVLWRLVQAVHLQWRVPGRVFRVASSWRRAGPMGRGRRQGGVVLLAGNLQSSRPWCHFIATPVLTTIVHPWVPADGMTHMVIQRC